MKLFVQRCYVLHVICVQLEGAVEGKNGFQPNDVLRLTAAAAPKSDVPAPLTQSVPEQSTPAPASEQAPTGPPASSNLTRQDAARLTPRFNKNPYLCLHDVVFQICF